MISCYSIQVCLDLHRRHVTRETVQSQTAASMLMWAKWSATLLAQLTNWRLSHA